MCRSFSWPRPIQRRRESLVLTLEAPHVPPRTVLMGRVIVDPGGLIALPGVRLPGRSCEATQRAMLVAFPVVDAVSVQAGAKVNINISATSVRTAEGSSGHDRLTAVPPAQWWDQ